MISCAYERNVRDLRVGVSAKMEIFEISHSSYYSFSVLVFDLGSHYSLRRLFTQGILSAQFLKSDVRIKNG